MRAQMVALQAELAGRAAGVVTGKTMGFNGFNVLKHVFLMVLPWF